MPSRFLGLVIPGGWEAYFDELPDLIAKHADPPPPKVMADLGRRYNVIKPRHEFLAHPRFW